MYLDQGIKPKLTNCEANALTATPPRRVQLKGHLEVCLRMTQHCNHFEVWVRNFSSFTLFNDSPIHLATSPAHCKHWLNLDEFSRSTYSAKTILLLIWSSNWTELIPMTLSHPFLTKKGTRCYFIWKLFSEGLVSCCIVFEDFMPKVGPQ